MKSKVVISLFGAALMLACNLFASDHLDAPNIMSDGRLDVNDSYIFLSPQDPNTAVLIMTINPGAGVLSPTTFHASALYEFNVDNNGDAVPDVTYSFNFSQPLKDGVTQRYSARRNGALVSRGLTGNKFRTLRTKNGGRIRCDVFDDPFFFDLVGFQNGFAFTGEDFFAGLDVTAIVMEVPVADIVSSTDLNVSLCARTVLDGNQVDRVGRPAINTALIPSKFDDAFNEGLPVNDPADYAAIVQAQIEGLNGGDSATAAALTAILLPDVLTVDLAAASGFLNGRALADDVIDAELGLLSNGAVPTDFVDENDVPFLERFPYLAARHN